MEEILISYYENNARKLHGVVDKILLKFGWLTNKDMDDFYSIANETFVEALRNYDGVRLFDGFLHTCLSNKILSEITRRNREKRKADRMCVSLDMPVGENGEYTIGDLLSDDFDLEEELFERMDVLAIKLERYLARLTKQQKKVLEMLAYCYKATEIQETLHMTPKQYTNALTTIRSYENVKFLF